MNVREIFEARGTVIFHAQLALAKYGLAPEPSENDPEASVYAKTAPPLHDPVGLQQRRNQRRSTRDVWVHVRGQRRCGRYMRR